MSTLANAVASTSTGAEAVILHNKVFTTNLRNLIQQWEEFRHRSPAQYVRQFDKRMERPGPNLPNCDDPNAFHRISPPPLSPLPSRVGWEIRLIKESELHTSYTHGIHGSDLDERALWSMDSKDAYAEIVNAHPLLIRSWAMSRIYRPRLKERFRNVLNTIASVSNIEYDHGRDVVVHFDRWRESDKLNMLNELIAALNTQLFVLGDGKGNYTGAWCRFTGHEMKMPKGYPELAIKRATAWATWAGMDKDDPA